MKQFIQLLLIICLLFLCSHFVLAGDIILRTIDGEKLNKNNEISINKNYGLYGIEFTDNEMPTKLSWSWNGKGQGQAWLVTKYSDNNVIYSVMEGSELPKIDIIKFIDSEGIPRVIRPAIVSLPKGNVNIDLIENYHKYCGAKDANIKEIQFYVKSNGKLTIKKIKVEEFQKKFEEAKNENELLLDNDIHIEAQIPQGNMQDYYLVKDMETPIEVTVKGLPDKKSSGFIKIVLLENMEVISTTKDKISFIENNTLVLPIEASAGYFEEKIVLIVKSNKTGKFTIQTELGELSKTLSKTISSVEKSTIEENFLLIDYGVYPIKNDEIKKELKNNINIKQDITDYIHRTFGSGEDETSPTGYITGVIKNTSSYDIPVHIKYATFNQDGTENKFFRGEHFLIDSAEPPPVPETNVVIRAGSITDFQLPVYADAFSIEPGVYESELKISFFASDTEILNENFTINVYKETPFQNIIVFVSILLAIISLILLIIKHKKWLGILKSKEIMLIALFTTVKFAVVDVPYSVFGKVIRGILAPLGPFSHLFTGIFSDLFDSLLIVTFVILIPKPGVIIISKVLRIILGGIAFGSFNPVTIILSLSYALILEALLYKVGFTSGKKSISKKFNVFLIISIIFGIQQLYSTYTYYYVYMYLYRLFYPDWYINISAIFSVFYAIVGAIAGIYLGKKLKKVVE